MVPTIPSISEIDCFPQIADLTNLNDEDPRKVVLRLMNAAIEFLNLRYVKNHYIQVHREYMIATFLRLKQFVLPRLRATLSAEDAGIVVQDSLQTWVTHTRHLEAQYIYIWNVLLDRLDCLQDRLAIAVTNHMETGCDDPFDSEAWFRANFTDGALILGRQYLQGNIGVLQSLGALGRRTVLDSRACHGHGTRCQSGA